MPNDFPPEEMRMRAALGLRGPHRSSSHQLGQSPQRRRFARDGEVPVTVINPARPNAIPAKSPRMRMMALEEALATEQSAHARTRRALDDALATIKALETKGAHAELAYADAIRKERSARERAETTVQELQAQLQETEARVRQLEPATASQPSQMKRGAAASGQIRRFKTQSGTAEAEPVKWWLPSYRASKHRR